MISREESDLLFEQLDTDGNGTLNFIEAKAGSKKLKVCQVIT
jgi:Ca2+-binding EF-hand superfamily protein